MFRSKYSTVLTILLIILIIAIIGIATFLAIKAYRNYEDEKEKQRVIADLQEEANNTIDGDNKNNNTVSDDDNIIGKPVDENITNNNNTSSDNQGGTTTVKKTKFYKEFPMVGYIKIPKTKAEYPILLDTSPAALEVAVGVMYPTNPKLNQPGNTVIIGHNYRNGKFFSNNKKLENGDKIQITDLTGKTLTYTIYEIFQTTSTDTEYITRERNSSSIEVSLSTCTDDGKDRLVILARAE